MSVEGIITNLRFFGARIASSPKFSCGACSQVSPSKALQRCSRRLAS